MTRVYIADAILAERSALRLMVLDLNMEVIGNAADWKTTLALAPATRPDMVLVGWDLLPTNLAIQALAELRLACKNEIVIVLISLLEARQQAAISAGADVFISRSDMPERVALHLRLAAARVHPI
jgi:DNA-binding NarL/FixJ family response regulator